NQTARMLQTMGLKHGDSIALLMDTSPRFHEVAWAPHRSGLVYVAISTKLQEDEILYIIEDSGAQVLIVDANLAPLAERLIAKTPTIRRRLSVGGSIPGYEDYEPLRDAEPALPVDDETSGIDMLYSSGTTGRPKGIKARMERSAIDAEHPILRMMRTVYGFEKSSVYLSPAPIYHGAPLRWTMGLMRAGATCVLMERFDPEECLALIEKHKVTHAQFVPTMFVRMLKLPEAVRRQYDLSSLQYVFHGAAPCPVEIKQAMIDWVGPIIHEFYGASEAHGQTSLNSEEWLSHRGSVGKPVFGIIHILDDDGNEVPTGESGTIWFESPSRFEYHKDPAKTASATNAQGWQTVGDVGYVDAEGYLYLTDRKANLIISGGVNIYPQEAEDLLLTHPKVMDAAVFGVPNEEFGEEVKAVVQLMDASQAGPELEAELIGYCRERLSHIKCPRTIDFEQDFPRMPSGKLVKRRLRDRYWEGRASKII
ncbi:MAG: acyl-CoA synthetase, partial [Rhizobiaceae bacterium]